MELAVNLPCPADRSRLPAARALRNALALLAGGLLCTAGAMAEEIVDPEIARAEVFDSQTVVVPETQAPIDETLLADCNAPAHYRVLQRSELQLDAAAIWLDARHLRWPQAPAEARVVLLQAGLEPLQLAPGSPPEGLAQSIELEPRESQASAAVSAAFAWFGDGSEFTLPPSIDVADLLVGDTVLAALDADGAVLIATRVQQAAALDQRFAAAESVALGAHALAAGARFDLWAPTALGVSLCHYPDDETAASLALPMQRDNVTGVWTLASPNAGLGSYYTYLVDVFVPGQGVVRNRVTDPYALGLGADSLRAMVVDLDHADFKPAGWDEHPRPEAPASNVDMVLYELHVRDFSRDDDTVDPRLSGRYLGFAEPGTRGMRHLRELAEAGLTDVHLLPSYDIASIPERGCVVPLISGRPDSASQQAEIAMIRHEDCYNWGYDPQHYSVPEGSYASDPSDGAVRIREFRQMVMALHALGLRVGLDVVYNHTSHAGQHPRSVLDRIVPGYYHRLNNQGEIERSTCCENTATEHRMMARLMIDSAAVWARDYRIDGFRFDLMGHQPKAAMLQLQVEVDAAAGRRIPIIGEGWNFGEVADGARFVQASQLSLPGSGIATFSDRARDALRGGGAGTSGAELRTARGWLNRWDSHVGDAEAKQAPAPADAAAAANPPTSTPQSQIPSPRSTADLVRVGLAGSVRAFELQTADGGTRRLEQIDYAGQPAGYVTSPEEVVNYVENHDNQTLFDINVLRLPDDTAAEERARVQLLAAAVNLLSQGVPYFHAGIEVLRSKSLDRNSYDSGDHFNRLDYSGADNGFGRGLPPAWDNEADWPLLQPLLAREDIRPSVELVDFTRRAFLDLLRIRAQTPLLRLRSADDIQRRLRFLNAGPDQIDGVIVVQIDGSELEGSTHAAVLYAVNADVREHQVPLPGLRADDWRLHPVQANANAADERPKAARLDTRRGLLSLPARTAVVFVRE